MVDHGMGPQPLSARRPASRMGLAIGTAHPDAAHRLLRLIEAEEPERAELGTDAEQFIAEALA